jgi:hypothetical protein
VLPLAAKEHWRDSGLVLSGFRFLKSRWHVLPVLFAY